MSHRSWAFAPGLLLAACSPEPTALVDGRPVADLARAAGLAGPGSVIELLPGDHVGGVILPDGVRLVGPEARILGPDRLVDAVGALTVEGIALTGGSADEGGLVHAVGDLVLIDVDARDARADVPIRARRELDVRGGSFAAPVPLRTGNAMGRPRRVALTDVDVTGIVEVPADSVDVTGLSGAADLRTSGQALLIQDSALAALDVRSPAVNLAGVTVDGPASIVGDQALLLDLHGGTWSVDVRELTARNWSADAIAGSADWLAVEDVRASLLVLDGSFADVRGLEAAELDLSVDTLSAEDVRGQRVALFGLGVVRRVAAVGPGAQLALGPLRVTGALVRSTEGPARVSLVGADVEGMAVVEPLDVVDAGPVLDALPYGLLEHFTWLGGRRARLTPPGSRLFLGQSIVAGWELGPPDDATFDGTVLWHLDGSLPPVPQAIVQDPRFVAPGDPHVRPDSPHVGRGAFAGTHAADVEALWAASP